MNGRKVACILSKEIAARFVTEAAERNTSNVKNSDDLKAPEQVNVPRVTIVAQYQTLNDQVVCNKHACNRQVDHQVHATLAKDSLFQVDNDCKGIYGHYSNSFDVKNCQPGNCTRMRKRAANLECLFCFGDENHWPST